MMMGQRQRRIVLVATDNNADVVRGQGQLRRNAGPIAMEKRASGNPRQSGAGLLWTLKGSLCLYMNHHYICLAYITTYHLLAYKQ